MNTTSTENQTAVPLSGVQSAANQIGENVGNRAVNWIIDKLTQQYGKALVLTQSVYTRYLKNAFTRYNQVKTLVTGIEPRPIIGQKNIYIHVEVSYRGREYSTATVEELLRVSKNILICGSGGTGKSMLMRYLFLNTVNRGEHIPVLLELRKITGPLSSENSFMELILKSMKDFDIDLSVEQFEYSLRLGKYIFFLDGFDEIKSNLTDCTAAAIQSFASKYPQNAYIITSRPDQQFSSLETFTHFHMNKLTKTQAISLSQKFWPDEEKTIAFCKQLDQGLFYQHKDFAENPLLLSMMFLTFWHNNSIPDHLADFYSKCYSALYSAHDKQNKGMYKREFESSELDEKTFEMLFAGFCFNTYFNDKYEFTKREITQIVNQRIVTQKITNAKANSYLNDLCKVVCLIVHDGDTFRFAHRSFQTYFAARYTSERSDEEQKKIFRTILNKADWRTRDDYFILSYQLENERFLLNALEQPLRKIKDTLATSLDPNRTLFEWIYQLNIGPSRYLDQRVKRLKLMRMSSDDLKIRYTQNAIELLRIVKGLTCDELMYGDKHLHIIRLLLRCGSGDYVSFDDIEQAYRLNSTEKEQIRQHIMSYAQIPATISAINNVLQSIDDMRASLKTTKSIFDII